MAGEGGDISEMGRRRSARILALEEEKKRKMKMKMKMKKMKMKMMKMKMTMKTRKCLLFMTLKYQEYLIGTCLAKTSSVKLQL